MRHQRIALGTIDLIESGTIKFFDASSVINLMGHAECDIANDTGRAKCDTSRSYNCDILTSAFEHVVTSQH